MLLVTLWFIVLLAKLYFQKSRQNRGMALQYENTMSANQHKLPSSAKTSASSIFELCDVTHNQVLFDETFCQKNFLSLQDSTSKNEQEPNCDIIIGMHPDQATEPIIDMALKYQKPFAVVPCCVFAHENPHRRLKNQE